MSMSLPRRYITSIFGWGKNVIKKHTPHPVKTRLLKWALSNSMEIALMRLKKNGFYPSAILDIGAYEGEWSRLASKVWSGTTVWMFEAQKEKKVILEKVVGDLQNVKFTNALLGSQDKEDVTFYVMETGSSIYAEQTSAPRKSIKSKMQKLDTIIEMHRFALGGNLLIKIDVQGAELDVIRGAAATLIGCEFLLLECSVVEYNERAPLLLDTLKELHELGYVPYDIASIMRLPSGELSQLDVLFCRSNSKYRPTGRLW